MKKPIFFAILAAFLLSGCGSVVSDNNIQEQEVHKADLSSKEDLEPRVSQNQEPEVTSPSRRIVCWGDSLTEGTGGEGVTFPKVIEELTGIETINYGVYGECSSLIAARQGGNGQHVENISEIPADTEPVPIKIKGDKDGASELWLTFGDAGVNPCMIAGVMGELSIDPEDSTKYFTRLEAGEAVAINNDNDTFYTHGMLDAREDDILIIWSGSSDGLVEGMTVDIPIDNIRSMLEYSGCEEYVILDYEAVCLDGRFDEWNDALRDAFGEHVLDIREYLLEHGLEDAGIEPTEGDLEDIALGHMPRSIMSDEYHGTGDFYRIIGEQIVEKMRELGYIE